MDEGGDTMQLKIMLIHARIDYIYSWQLAQEQQGLQTTTTYLCSHLHAHLP
jgi:hypothetical protein